MPESQSIGYLAQPGGTLRGRDRGRSGTRRHKGTSWACMWISTGECGKRSAPRVLRYPGRQVAGRDKVVQGRSRGRLSA
eukprot:8372378-Pyramimonas_sp.AAC.1